MSSEAGTYEGRFVLREAALLSPYGAPSAEKQDPIWRSVTKEFQLRHPDALDPKYIPGWRSTAWEQLTGSPELNSAKFTVGSIDPETRTALINELRSTGREDLASVLGRMGETGFVLNESFSNNFTVEGMSKYNVNEVGVKVGDVVGPDDVIGFRDFNRVIPKHLGTVEDIARDENGFVVNVRHELAMQGAKIDVAGIKGMVPTTMPNPHFEELREIVNAYYAKTGTGDAIPSTVTALAPAEYFANKVEPTQAYLGMGQDLVSRLEQAGASEVYQDYLSKMQARLATSYQGGQLVIDAAKIQALDDKAAAARLRDLSQISEEFFQKAGEAIKNAGGYQDPVLTAYVQSGKALGDWMLKNQLPASGFAWDHSLVNAPRFASVTHDIGTYMALGGKWSGLKALQNRVVTSSGGSAQQSLDFMQYVMGRDYSKPMGVTVPLKDALLGRGNLNAAKNRAGSIFDPSIASYRENFRLDLGNGRFLPVPGTDAYGAESKMFAPGEYQTRPWQNTLQTLATTTDAEKQKELADKVILQYEEAFGTGKGNVLRPYLQDPLSIAGVFSNIAEEENPFVAKISPELARKVRSQRLREALLRGEEVMGALHRQPTNTMLYMKFKVDEAMRNTLDVGVAERISRAFIGDQDKDTAYALLFDANIRMREGQAYAIGKNPLESAAAKEAYDMIHNGEQLGYLEAWEGIRGVDEVANRVTGFSMKPLSERAASFATAVGNRTNVAVKRTAGAAIGPFSNILTEMTEHMVRNPTILKDPKMAARLTAVMFEASRQAPISARKASSFSLEQAMSHIERMKQAIATPNDVGAATKLQESIINLGKTLHKDFESTAEYSYLTGLGAEDLQTWARGRSEFATLAKQGFTSVVDKSRPFAGQAAERNLEKIFQNLPEVLGPVHGGGRAATESASRIGLASEVLANKARDTARSARGRLAKVFAEHGTGMALGLGSLAALGIAMTAGSTPVASFSRASGNKYRPEDRIGVADHIPGESMEGQMAPSNPPRREVANQPGVRTSVVAPMRQTSDLSVRMRAEDQSRAAETARQLSQIPGSGNTNVTINYRDKTRLRSLRTREKVREILQ